MIGLEKLLFVSLLSEYLGCVWCGVRETFFILVVCVVFLYLVSIACKVLVMSFAFNVMFRFVCLFAMLCF